MKTKQQKGKEIAKTAKIRFENNLWIVPSQTGKGEYTVDLSRQTCTCPDFCKTLSKCKHLYAVEEELQRQFQAVNAGVKKKKSGNRIPRRQGYFSDYNLAQTQGRAKFFQLARELCRFPQRQSVAGKKGRKALPINEILFCLIAKVYETCCARDSINYLGEALSSGFISRKPHFNSVCNYFRKDWMTDVLSELLTLSSLPLAAIEKSFSVDSTGFGTKDKKRWFDVKYGNNEEWHDWKKAHIICGNSTQIVVGAFVSPAYAHDSPFFIPLVEKAANFFHLEEVLADAAYSSRENLEFVESKKARPFIAFKKNAVLGSQSEVWNKLLHFYSFNKTEFHEHYRHRSNVESAIAAIKTNFGEWLRSRDERGQINELLVKLICYNLCVLVRSMFDLNIDIDLLNSTASLSLNFSSIGFQAAAAAAA